MTKNANATNAFLFDIGVIYGFVYNDKNADGRVGFGERGEADVIVYLDTNDNGMRDSDELFTRTSRRGFYFFVGLPSGDYVVRQETPFGQRNVTGGEGEDFVPRILEGSQSSGGDVTAQIIGGAEVEIEEYPFMVALAFDDGPFGFFQFCGGVIISDRFVATAAHCLDGLTDQDLPFVKIIAGTNNVDDGSGFILDVAGITLHPDFVPAGTNPTGPESVTAGFDIAVIELAEAIDLEASGLQSVSMLDSSNAALANDGVLATTVGWGASDNFITLLQDVHVPIFDTQECEIIQDNQFGVANFETQICAGTPEGGIDACQGDSGGPLLVRNFAEEKWRIAGFTSYGLGCAEPNNPGVWSRASVLSSWAEGVAREDSRAFRISLGRGDFARANFGNQSSLYETALPIEPRWQLVNAIFSGNLDDGVNVDFRIIDEAESARTFNCAADLDGAGPLAPSEFDCFSGNNTFEVGNPAAGIFVPDFVAQLDNTFFTRTSTPLVLGDLEENSVAGELTVDDPFDFDYLEAFGEEYYIDYFDLSGVIDENARLIEVASDDFLPFVALYDRDIRENSTIPFASELDIFSSAGAFGELAQLITQFPAGTNYIIGVSTLFQLETGTYTVKVVNGGSAEPTVLSVPELEAMRLSPERVRKLDLPKGNQALVNERHKRIETLLQSVSQ